MLQWNDFVVKLIKELFLRQSVSQAGFAGSLSPFPFPCVHWSRWRHHFMCGTGWGLMLFMIKRRQISKAEIVNPLASFNYAAANQLCT